MEFDQKQVKELLKQFTETVQELTDLGFLRWCRDSECDMRAKYRDRTSASNILCQTRPASLSESIPFVSFDAKL
jgi:hypothetical protein